VLYRSSLTDPATLDQFTTGTNVLLSIVDGAKRDRLAFTGDIGISGLTLLYSSFALEYLEGCIQLFSDYQRIDGRIATYLPPQYDPGSHLRRPSTLLAFLSRTTICSTSPRFITISFTPATGRFSRRNGQLFNGWSRPSAPS